MMQLSKSDYMLFLKHPAWLWLKKHNKSKLPPVDEALQAVFDDGHLFEKYADKLFTDAVLIGFSFEDNTYITMPQRTKKAIVDGNDTILQGRVEVGNITCIFDVLQKVGDNEFDLYEIKSSNEVKKEHVLDLAFQTVVMENAGFKIRKLIVVYSNKEYIRKGEIDINQMILQLDVTEKVRAKIDETKENIKKALSVMNSSTPPDFSPRHVGLGAFKDWMAIYEALYPEEHPYSIYKLSWLDSKIFGELEDLGVKIISDIPDLASLNAKQISQVQATKTGKRMIDKEKIKDFISKITYPLFFFDYETFKMVIPPYDGIHPHQQVPFQYSLHILESDGTMTHKEFLHTENSNPGIHLLEQLKRDIGEKGTVFVWYEIFEKGVNEDLAEMFPEYKDFLLDLNNRVIDLMKPFWDLHFTDKDFFGSASIKNVLPVLVPELSYKDLNIQEGLSAQRTWTKTFFEGLDNENREQISKDLLKYCELDTLAMVRIFEKLKEI